MTVANTSSRKTFTGDGVTTSFATSPVVFFETSNLVVSVVTTATGAATTLTENTHYTVSGGDGSTGTVDLSGGSAPYGAPSAAQTLVIVRDLPLTQSADPDNGDNSDAEVIEEAADRLTMMVQQLQRQIDGAFRLADTDVSGADATIPTPAASKLIGWDDAGTALQNYAAADIDLALVSAFAETLLDDTTAAAARTTLGAASTATATISAAGLIELATQAEIDAGTDTDRAVAPFRLTSWTPATATIDTANDLLIVRDATDSKIKKMAWPSILTQAPYARLEDQKSSGTHGGGAAATSWNTRTLNTEAEDAGGIVTLAANQFTLAAGTYHIRAEAQAMAVAGHQLRLRNITDSSTPILGASQYADGASVHNSLATLSGNLTIAASKVFELQHWTGSANAGDGLGVASSATGANEVYARVEIWRLA